MGKSYILFTDETNKEFTPGVKFFIYGGAIVESEKLGELHYMMEQIRKKYKYNPPDEFKFAVNSKPSHITKTDFSEAKNEVLIGCSRIGVVFIACLTLHQIAKNKQLSELVGFGANTLFGKFDTFLLLNNATGICIVDRLPFGSDYGYLKEKFQVGLKFKNGSTSRLNRINMFATSCEGATHAISAIDILLGSFRYCVNEKDKDIVPKKLFPVVAKMMWYKVEGKKRNIREYGLMFRPKKVIVPEYEREYRELVDRFNCLLSSS